MACNGFNFHLSTGNSQLRTQPSCFLKPRDDGPNCSACMSFLVYCKLLVHGAEKLWLSGPYRSDLTQIIQIIFICKRMSNVYTYTHAQHNNVQHSDTIILNHSICTIHLQTIYLCLVNSYLVPILSVFFLTFVVHIFAPRVQCWTLTCCCCLVSSSRVPASSCFPFFVTLMYFHLHHVHSTVEWIRMGSFQGGVG